MVAQETVVHCDGAPQEKGISVITCCSLLLFCFI